MDTKTLIEAYESPIAEIRGLPPQLVGPVRRLVAGKRLLLFSQLELAAGRRQDAAAWLARAIEVAPEDPEIIRFARQFGEFR